MATALGLSLQCHGGAHGVWGRVTTEIAQGSSHATTQMFSCIGRHLKTQLSIKAKGKTETTVEVTKAVFI